MSVTDTALGWPPGAEVYNQLSCYILVLNEHSISDVAVDVF